MIWIRILVYIRNFEIFLLLTVLTITCILLINNLWSAIENVQYHYRSHQRTSCGIDEEFKDIPLKLDMQLENQLKTWIQCHNQSLEFHKFQYGNYWILKNYIRGRLSETVGCIESITYTTNADYTFLDNLPIVVKRWLAPVSLALFAPGYDFNSTMDSIQYLRNCLPESDLIRQHVTFHIYFPNDHMPDYVPLTDEEALFWSFDCQNEVIPYNKYKQQEKTYKTKMELLYPINVGRNIARKAANTYFVFASDIEIYPSRGLVQNFLQMLVHNKTEILRKNVGNLNNPRVFALPIFEIKKSHSLPETKETILEMLKNRTAVVFHSYVCRNCHLVPGYEDWLNHHKVSNNNLEIIATSKREGKYAYWEPFYVSDNREPWFDERIFWEGHSDKRIQNYAMCLMNYEYLILHPGFLIHRPGIKKFNRKDPLLKFVSPTNHLIKHKIKPEYKILYGNNYKCYV